MRKNFGSLSLVVFSIAAFLFVILVASMTLFSINQEVTIQKIANIAIVIAAILGLVAFLVEIWVIGKQRGRPLNLQKKGAYIVLKSIPPESRKTGNELWRLLVVEGEKKNILLLGYPHSWLDVRGNTGRDRLEISKVEGRHLFHLYLTSVPSLPGIPTPTPDLEGFEAETGKEP